jgi:hypothetical protein
MLATLTVAAMIAQQPAAQATNFTYRFTKDETMAYAVKVSGSDNGTDVVFDLEFEVTTTGEAKDGKTPCHIKFQKVVASFGGSEQPMDAPELDVLLDKYGAPTAMDMEGASAVCYVALVLQYVPNKSLSVGETFKADLDLGGARVVHEGTYSGDEELGGKKYPVIKSKSTLTPSGQEPGNLTSKSYFDAATGKVVRIESTIGTPDGEFELSVVAKPKK